MTDNWCAGVAMQKALKRAGWLLIATGAVAVAYHAGNLTSPSVRHEPTCCEAADLADPTPVAGESSLVEAESQPAGEIIKAADTVRRARIISVTAIHGLNDPRKNSRASSPAFLPGYALQE